MSRLSPSPSPCRRAKSPHGFTFVEILAALVFLAILIPAILEGITLSSRASLMAERGTLAAELAQNKLNELTLNNTWMTGETSGNFGDDWPGIRWEATHSAWEMDSMEQLTVKTFFTVQGREHALSLSTLVSSGTTSTSGTASSSSSTSSNTR